MSTKISWCDETINPVVGCSKISSGCKNCYAENMARRLAAMGIPQYKDVIQHNWPSADKWNGHAAFVESELHKPSKWKKPRSVFVSSMGDLFHDAVNVNWQLAVLDMVNTFKQHTFIFLTKRPENMRRLLSTDVAAAGAVLPNLIVGVSVEDQQTADERIPVLLATPAAKRFISIEPMIGPVDIWDHLKNYLQGFPLKVIKPALNGVILGGESGNQARDLDPLWAIQVRDQCAAAGVPFMFKQWSHRNRNEINPETGFPALQDGRTHTALPWQTRKAL